MVISTAIAPVWKQVCGNEAQILAALRECGFSYFCEELSCDKEYSAGFIAERAQMLKDNGLTAVKARALINSAVPQERDIIKLISACAMMGINRLVIPLASKENNTRKEYMELNRAYLAPLLKAAGDSGVTLMIEQAGNYQNAHYTHCGMELNALWEYLGCPEKLKFNVNIARLGLADMNIYPDIRVLGKNIMSVDASDNFFAMPLGVDKEREDLGLAPLMGFLDFDEALLALKETEYKGEFNLLMNSPRVFEKNSPYVTDSRLKVMPLELVKRYYAWTYKVCRYMLTVYGMNEEADA